MIEKLFLWCGPPYVTNLTDDMMALFHELSNEAVGIQAELARLDGAWPPRAMQIAINARYQFLKTQFFLLHDRAGKFDWE